MYDDNDRPRRRQRTFTDAFGTSNFSGDQPGDERPGGWARIEDGPVGPVFQEELDEI